MVTSDENKKGFLVFKRRIGEGFVINGNIDVYIKKIGKNYATLAIRSPKGTKILRMELRDSNEIPKENS